MALEGGEKLDKFGKKGNVFARLPNADSSEELLGSVGEALTLAAMMLCKLARGLL